MLGRIPNFSYTVEFVGELCSPHRRALLARDEYEKRYGKKYGEIEMEKKEAMEKTHITGKKVFRMAPLDSLF